MSSAIIVQPGTRRYSQEEVVRGILQLFSHQINRFDSNSRERRCIILGSHQALDNRRRDGKWPRTITWTLEHNVRPSAHRRQPQSRTILYPSTQLEPAQQQQGQRPSTRAKPLPQTATASPPPKSPLSTPQAPMTPTSAVISLPEAPAVISSQGLILLPFLWLATISPE